MSTLIVAGAAAYLISSLAPAKRDRGYRLRRWQVSDAYSLGRGSEDGARCWTFAGARKTAQRLRGARIVNLNYRCYRTRGRKWSERENGYLGEYVCAHDVLLLLQLASAPEVTPESVEHVLDHYSRSDIVRSWPGADGTPIYHALDILRHQDVISPRLTSDSETDSRSPTL